MAGSFASRAVPIVRTTSTRSDKFTTSSPRSCRRQSPSRADLSPEHVIVDAATGHVAGILDWTDTILGDPARDFVFLVTWRGWEFAEDVLRRYPHAVDRDFRERLRFMARLLSVMWLAMAHAQHGNVAMHIEWVRNAFAPRVRS